MSRKMNSQTKLLVEIANNYLKSTEVDDAKKVGLFRVIDAFLTETNQYHGFMCTKDFDTINLTNFKESVGFIIR